MIVKLFPSQVPTFWEIIKFACVKACNVKDEYRERYLNNLLTELLAGNAQAFVGYDDSDNVTMVFVTHASADLITGQKTIYIDCLYSFKPRELNGWQEGLNLILDLAKKLECVCIIAYSINPAIYKLAESLGFSETLREFRLEVNNG